VGEIGLDHAIEDRDDADQEAVFLSQLRLSRDLNLPVTMHCRRAWGRLLELLTPLGPHPAGMLIHSYSGADDLVPTLAKFNVFFSFSGSITFSGHRKRHRALRAVPLDRLLIETDAPDIPPYIPGTAEKAHGRDGRVDGWKDGKIDEGPAVEDPRREERPLNEPANLIYVAEAAARLLGVSVEELARLTWDNAERLFGPCVR
jgi:TatD DNase family protein